MAVASRVTALAILRALEAAADSGQGPGTLDVKLRLSAALAASDAWARHRHQNHDLLIVNTSVAYLQNA
jgi:hypothetical protein